MAQVFMNVLDQLLRYRHLLTKELQIIILYSIPERLCTTVHYKDLTKNFGVT